MTYASQFAGGAPIGSQVLMSDLGPTVTLADNSTWMRAGVLTTYASAPQLAALPQYKVISGITSTITAQSPYNASMNNKMASNGAGIIIALNSNAILKSTDSGATWIRQDNSSGTGLYSTVSYNDIVYANGKFVMIGQYSNIYVISWSTNAAAWTSFTLNAPTDWTGNAYGATSYNNACGIVWTGTYFVAATLWREGYSSTNAFFTTNLGSTATSAAAHVRPSATTSAASGDSSFDFYATVLQLSSNGAGGLVLSTTTNSGISTGKFAYSANHGTNWTLYIGPPGYMLSGTILVGTKVFATGGSNNTSLYVYNTPSSTPTIIPNITASTLFVAGTNAGYTAGTKVFAYNSTLGQILEFDTTTYTTIVSNKQLLGTIGGTNGGNYGNNYMQYIDSKFITLGLELGISAARSYTSNFDNITYYGIVKQFGANNNQYYVRIS